MCPHHRHYYPSPFPPTRSMYVHMSPSGDQRRWPHPLRSRPTTAALNHCAHQHRSRSATFLLLTPNHHQLQALQRKHRKATTTAVTTTAKLPQRRRPLPSSSLHSFTAVAAAILPSTPTPLRCCLVAFPPPPPPVTPIAVIDRRLFTKPLASLLPLCIFIYLFYWGLCCWFAMVT